MTLIKSLSFEQARTLLTNKRVHMIAKCELFPNFNITGTVHNIFLRGGVELILKVKNESNNRVMDISGNMKGLAFEFV